MLATLALAAVAVASLSITGNLTVGGTTTHTGTATFNADVTLSGAGTDLAVGGNFSVTGTSSHTGAASFGAVSAASVASSGNVSTSGTADVISNDDIQAADVLSGNSVIATTAVQAGSNVNVGSQINFCTSGTCPIIIDDTTSPNASVNAAPGSLYMRQNTTTPGAWVNTSATSLGTTWKQLATTDAFTTSAAGLAPASGGGTTNFLRADGSWAAPPGGSTTFSGASARFAGGVTITTGTETLVTFDTEIYDTSAYHDNSTNPSRFIAPTTGYYLFVASANWQADAAGIRYIHVQKNAAGSSSGGTGCGQSWSAPAASGPTIHQVSGVVQMTAGDYLELFVYQSTGGSKTLTLDPPNAFTISFLGG